MESYSVQAVLSAVDKGFSSTINSALGSLKGVGNTATKATGSIMKIASGIGVFKAVSAGANLVKSSISSAFDRQDTMEQFNRTMTAITGNAGAADSALDVLRATTKGTAYGLGVAAKATQDFVTRGMEIGSATKSVGAWADAVSFYGKGTDAELQNVTDAIAKMRTKGTVEMDQLNRLFDVGIDAVGMYAKAMGRDSASVQDDLSNGKISAEDFLNTVETAMMEGTNGVQKIAGAAKEAGASWTGTFDNMHAAVTRGVLGIINSIDSMLANNGFPTMRESIKSFGDAAESVLNRVGDLISGINLKGIVDTIKPYWDALKDVASEVAEAFGSAFSAVGDALKKLYGQLDNTKSLNNFSKVLDVVKGVLESVAGFIEDHADGIANLISKIPTLIAAYGGFKLVKGILKPFAKLASLFKGTAKDTIGASTGVTSLKDGLNSLQKSAGIALVIGALAGLALAIKPLAELGMTAVPSLLAFGGVVAGLALVLGSMGQKLQTSVGGIIAFSASVSVMALAMALIASTGTEGAIAMAAFGVVVAALVAVFAIFGTALTMAIPAMIAFGATILMVGAGMALASVLINALTPFVEQLGNTVSQVASAISSAVSEIINSFSELVSAVADAVSQVVESIGSTLVNIIKQAGDSISQVVDSISDGFKKISDGVTEVVDAISGGFTSVLEAVAGVIQSIGDSARNAGEGFKSVAEGISLIAGLSIIDIGKSLGAVAIGIGEITGKGAGLQAVADGLTGISNAVTNASRATQNLNTMLMQMNVLSANVATSVTAVSAAFAGLKIPVIDATPMLSAFIAISVEAQNMAAIVVTAMAMILSVSVSGLSALQTSYASTYAQITSVVQNGVSRVSVSVQSGISRVTSITQSGMNSMRSTVSSGMSTIVSLATSGMSRFVSAIQSGMNQSVAAIQSGANSMVAAVNSMSGQMYSAGYNASMGLANGIEAGAGAAIAAAQSVANQVSAIMASALKEHSPSRVTKKIGAYASEGLAIGILDMMSMVKKSATRVADTAANYIVPDFKADMQYAFAGDMTMHIEAESFGGVSEALEDIKEELVGLRKQKLKVQSNLYLDGRKVSKSTATYDRDEIAAIEKKQNLLNGIR